MEKTIRQNLRRVGKQCKFRGVSPTKSGRWQAYFRKTYLGLYDTPEEAAKAHDAACVEELGEAAITNASLGLFESDLKDQIEDNGDGTAIIHLNKGYEALIDAEDIEKVQGYSWSKSGDVCLGYVSLHSNNYLHPLHSQRAQMRLHRLVLGQFYDRTRIIHLNGNKLDCRKSNLELEGEFRKR